MTIYVLTLLFLSVNFIGFNRPIQCECDQDIYYDVPELKYIPVMPCQLPKIETFPINDSIKVIVIVRSCKGKGTVQVYEWDKLIMEKQYKNAIRLTETKQTYSDLDGTVFIDSTYNYYEPKFKR